MGDASVEPLAVSVKGDTARFRVHARPRAKTSAIGQVRGGALDVSLAAPPVEGLANEELIRTLAEAIGVAKSRVRILHGASGREKLVEVRLAADLDAFALVERLRTR